MGVDALAVLSLQRKSLLGFADQERSSELCTPRNLVLLTLHSSTIHSIQYFIVPRGEISSKEKNKSKPNNDKKPQQLFAIKETAAVRIKESLLVFLSLKQQPEAKKSSSL